MTRRGAQPYRRRFGPAGQNPLLLLLALAAATAAHGRPACLDCHPDRATGFSPAHAFAAGDCTPCHGGDPSARDKAPAHAGLVAFPGNLSNADQTCGACHRERVEQVRASLMHSGRGMVTTTRRVFGEAEHPRTPPNDPPPTDLAHLGHGPADSLLRKLCAGCHLGKDKTEPGSDPLRDRGGGCLACHLGEAPAGTHRPLTAEVSDHRCLGCHSRSGRIALNYLGLAEVDEAALGREDPATLGRLGDGRLVRYAPVDAHRRAGLGCIDCHTAAGLMNAAATPADAPPVYQEDAVDITCRDCHDPRGTRVGAAALGALLRRVPFPVEADTEFLVTGRFGTPLWNLRAGTDSGRKAAILHAKSGDQRWAIPPYTAQDHPLAEEHRRLRCDACHSQWAPQCYGCHLRFDPRGRQTDHLEGRPTPGRWHQEGRDFRHRPPTLGVDAAGHIAPFIPGMILTIEHPDWPAPRFRRRFAALSPHTIGKARPCASCHRDPLALGLGRGTLEPRDRGWTLHPTTPPGPDGLPGDAWTRLDADRPGQGTRPGERSLDRNEIRRILAAPLPNPASME